MIYKAAVRTLALLLGCGAGTASPEVLEAGDVLVIRFTVSGSFNTPPDTLLLSLGITNVLAPFTTRTADLFDAGTLLGTHSNSFLGNAVGPVPLDPSNSFIAPGSVYTHLAPTTVDFSSILNGTIDGRIEFSIATGAMEIDLTRVDVDLLQATGWNVGLLVTPQPAIAMITIFHDGLGVSFCSGDGSGTACPCGNSRGAGEGCANSSGSGGVLAASGSLSASLDDLTLEATNLLPNQPALLFVGQAVVNAGDGIVFGDGLRCAGQNVVRLGVDVPDGSGTASWGPGLGAIGGWDDGDTRYFQGWYRDPSGSPCGAGFNLTQGIEATFEP